MTDFIAPLVPLGLAAGRIGNFINGELWGRVARPDAPWAMVFPQASAEDTRQALMAPAGMADLAGQLRRPAAPLRSCISLPWKA